MAEARRGDCSVCGREGAVTADGGLRHHFTEDPEQQAGPDSRKCRGVGLPPAGVQGGGTPGNICRVCSHPVQLTSNGRARSHLSVLDGKSCAGGSDWPLAVDTAGNRTDTAPRCGHRDGTTDADTNVSWLYSDDPQVHQSDLADRFEAAPATHTGRPSSHSSSAHVPALAAAVGDPGAVLDGRGTDPRDATVTRPVETVGTPPYCEACDTDTHRCPGCGTDVPHGTVACKECAAVECACNLQWASGRAMRAAGHDDMDCDGAPMVPPASQDAADADDLVFDATHRLTDSTGTEWVHPGTAPDCRLPDCCTHPQRPEQTTVAELDEGDHFIRHLAKAPLDRLVYRVGTPVTGPRSATVVSAGPHHGRTGTLTNLQEEITCTDEHGTPRPRREVAERTSSAPAHPASSESPGRAPGSTPPSPVSAPDAGTSSTPATASGPTAPAATSARTAETRTALPDAFTTAKAAVSESDRYDNYGRYKLLHPDTGKKVKWTRATTFAKSVQDTFALSMWSQRMTLKGAAMRQDITAAVLTLDVKADKDRVNALVEDAKKAAGDKVAANKGTAVHAFTEDRDKLLAGEDVDVRPVPEEFVPTVEAYEEILRAFGLEPVPGLIEFTTAVKQYEVAGTSDRVYRVTRDITVQLNKRTVTLYAGEYVIGDVKTGADLSYGWQEIAIQLALYAQGINTSGVWDWGTGRWGKPVLPDNPDVLLKVRTDVGLVPHLPVDRATTGAPLATLYAVDLDAGWSAAVLCASVRTWRKERALATPLEIADVTGEVPQADPQRPVSRPAIGSRPVTLEDRAKAVTSRAEASSVFQEAKAARVTVAELNRLTEIMQRKLESFVEQGS